VDRVERPLVRQVPVGPRDAGERLDRFLMGLLAGVPKGAIYRIVRRGEVRVNGKRAAPEQRLAAGDVVRVPPVAAPAPKPREAPRVLFEDERVFVIDKPAGAAVQGGVGLEGGLIDALRAERPGAYVELAHRLDRETSGCLVLSKSRAARELLHDLFEAGRVEKQYTALLCGVLEPLRRVVDAPLRTDLRSGGERRVRVASGGKRARSEFSTVRSFAPRATLARVAIATGRTHQIRVHSAYAGHPVAGDRRYGDPRANAEWRTLGLGRMFLHASSLAFRWPDGGAVEVEAPLPKELVDFLGRLG
jgi:23S rRNA pseudouridine955/2504/2580 synthase